MAVSSQLGKVGLTAERLEAKATITFEKAGEHFAITKSHLDLLARVPGAKQPAFDAAVRAAETGCPVSKLFRAEISVDARLDATP
jgi:osmotically inducible protein OsmC